MPNTYANKVQVTRGGQTETLIDLTADTAIASDVAQGKYFHLASGERVVGTATGGGGGAVYQDQDGYIVLSDQGGGSSVTVEALSVTQNGTYTAPTGKAYSPVTVAVSGGGDTWSWMGRNPVKLATMPAKHLTLRDLGLDQWTWSTSVTTLRASQAYAQSVSSLDLLSFDIYVLQKVHVHYDYGNWTPVSCATDMAFVGTFICFSTYSTAASAESGTPSGRSVETGTSHRFSHWYNSLGVESFSTGISGVYSNTLGQPTASSGDLTSITITPTTPIIYVGGNNTMFSSSAFDNLDLDKSYYDLETEVWRVDFGTSDRGSMVETARSIAINGSL